MYCVARYSIYFPLTIEKTSLNRKIKFIPYQKVDSIKFMFILLGSTRTGQIFYYPIKSIGSGEILFMRSNYTFLRTRGSPQASLVLFR